MNYATTTVPRRPLGRTGFQAALLGIGDRETLLSHPVVGASWEGFIIENLLIAAQNKVNAYFYRTAAGAEIDLVLLFRDQSLWAIEVKRSLAPKPEKGFYIACDDLKPARAFVV